MSVHWKGSRRSLWFAGGGALAMLGIVLLIHRTPERPETAHPSPMQRQLERIQADVADIRGLAFRHPVPARRVTDEEWRRHIRRELEMAPTTEHYWDVVRTLGLHRGPDLDPPEIVFENLWSLGDGAYDFYEKTILLRRDLNADETGVILAHELSHALQDQHFGLEKYLGDMARSPDANADVLLARRSVIEGEASYVDTLYQALTASHTPSREELGAAFAAHAETDWNPDFWEQLAANPELDDRTRAQLRRLLDTSKLLPPAMFELFMSAYLDGIAFVHAVHEGGWDEVARLYGDYPPVSTEQILHPEKWRAREEPAAFDWPPFDTQPLLEDWRLLQKNVMGERQWQAMFRLQGLAAEARAAAAGWNGDGYAVFRHRETDDMLLLVISAWDSEEDAAEFARSWRRALLVKHDGRDVPHRLEVRGKAVCLVEGVGGNALEALMVFNWESLPPEVSGHR